SARLALAVLGPGGAERWEYGALERAIRATGAGLLARGFAPGDRLLLRLGNSVDFPIAYLGAIAAGLVPAPSSAQLTEPEVATLISDLRPAGILRDPDVVCPDTSLPVLDLADLRALRDHPPSDYAMGDPERPAYIVFTSGTSGRPRGVVHAHRAIWARQMMMQGWYGLTGEDRLLHAGAFNWTYTLGTGLMDPWTAGATALIPAVGTDPATLPDLLRDHEATLFAAAPGVYRQLLRHHPKLDLPRLRHGLSAGEKMDPAIRDAWTCATGRPVHEAFGMSECSTFISSCPDAPADPATLGRAQPGRCVAILGEEDRPAELGAEGEIAVHRDDPGLMLGYLDAPEETAARLRNGWFLTGDRGAMDAEGQVTYLGRADDMMNAGGYRVSPIEVETAMAALPGLGPCAATDVEVKPGTRVIALFYTLAPGAADPGQPALQRHAEAHLARYKQPRLFLRRDALPVNANGKILRRRLREGYKPAP
ncbi:AMP-binding protein, partial [Aquicoccus sp. SCR17]|nr:AMP-binding protein [Carideicomes alvinocaridis]